MKEREGEGKEGFLSLPFFPTPPRSFTRAIFRAVVLYSETARKRLLRRLQRFKLGAPIKLTIMGLFRVPKLSLSKRDKCKTFLVKMSFICMRIKNHFHINDFFALILAL